jgi:hypothetical protein
VRDFPTNDSPRRALAETQRLQEEAERRLHTPQPENRPSLWSRLKDLARRTTSD